MYVTPLLQGSSVTLDQAATWTCVSSLRLESSTYEDMTSPMQRGKGGSVPSARAEQHNPQINLTDNVLGGKCIHFSHSVFFFREGNYRYKPGTTAVLTKSVTPLSLHVVNESVQIMDTE